MNFTRKLFHLVRTPHTYRFGLLLFVLLIAILSDGCQAASASINHEYPDHQQDAEGRQFGGFNANAAFNSNFGSSSFGVNLGPGNSGIGNSPTTSSFNIPSYSTTSSPNAFSNFNSLNNISNNKKDTKKNTYNDYNNQKYPGARIVDRFNHHYPDGSYEYRYELDDGTARYERGYFLLYDNKKTLVVVGYYSYRLSDGRYLTVFYNADQNGYRQNQSITPQSFPNLPRSIEVPQYKSKDTEDDYHSKITTTPNPRLTTTTRRGGHF